MMGTQPSTLQAALFSYHINLEHRVPAEHLLRRISATLDLSFVIPSVRHLYGRSGNVSLDPRVILKMLLLLFLYDIPSERELVEQIRVRLDFLWFLGFDLEAPVPDHSVLSKARARWGEKVFEKFFLRMVEQCVQAGLVNGSLLHLDSTIVKAQASKDSVVASGPELVSALRQAYQHQQGKLQVLPAPLEASASRPEGAAQPTAIPSQASGSQRSEPAPVAGALGTPAVETTPSELMPVAEPCSPAAVAPEQPMAPVAETQSAPAAQRAAAARTPTVRVLPSARVSSTPKPKDAKPAGKKLPVNRTHISTTDPEAQLARNKSGVTELNYKEHRLVDDAHGVITAVAASTSNVPDGSQLPALYEQHLSSTGLKQGQVTLAGDHHYGTASNYIYCAQAQVRAHLGDASANLEERGKLPLSQFVYEPAQDRLRCPQGHYLLWHQDRLEEQAKVYLIEDAALCGKCALREQCTKAKGGRSIQRHVQADLVEAARAEANSPAGRRSRQRRQHVMEGSFADAFNNHGAKQARWRGLARQRIQSWMIAAVQNLRLLVRKQLSGPIRVASAALAGAAKGTGSRVEWVRPHACAYSERGSDRFRSGGYPGSTLWLQLAAINAITTHWVAVARNASWATRPHVVSYKSKTALLAHSHRGSLLGNAGFGFVCVCIHS